MHLYKYVLSGWYNFCEIIIFIFFYDNKWLDLKRMCLPPSNKPVKLIAFIFSKSIS